MLLWYTVDASVILTLIGGCGVEGGGGISSVLRIQNGNSFTMLVPYDLETVTRSKYLQSLCS